MKDAVLSRRNFIKSSVVSGAWLLSINVPLKVGAATLKAASPMSAVWQVYMAINADNTVQMDSPTMDAGQFMRTTGPMMIAEEMDLDWDAIEFSSDVKAHIKRNDEGALTYRYAKINTGGSFSVRWTWDYLRQVGAFARHKLLEEAAHQLNAPLEQLKTEKSKVIHSPSGTTLTYGQLAAGAAAREINEDNVKLKDKSSYKIIGSEKRNIDLKKIVTGKPLFGLDEEYPNCLQVVVDRAPALGASIESYDKESALAVPGVIQLVETEYMEGSHFMNGEIQFVSAGVAVVADSLWAAIKGKRALNTRWKNTSKYAKENSAEQIKLFHKHVDSDFPSEVTQDFGNIEQAFKDADIVLDQKYEKPLYAHALMEPFNCIVDIRKDSATVIAGHQHPLRIAEEVEKYGGVSGLNVEVICKRMGGAFGRRYEIDWVREAVVLATKIKKPIKVTWMREDEIERDFFDPAMVARIRAGVKDGKVTAWHYRQSQTKGGIQDSSFPQGVVDNYKVERCKYESNIPVGPWRGPQHPAWAFANESMLDELAHKAGIDPYEFRMQLLLPEREFPFTNWGAEIKNSGRMARCYEEAAKMANWKKPRPAGTGLGIAGHICHGSYAAFVLEVTVKNNRLRLNEAWGAIDCGLPINPNHIRSQMEGGFLDGLSAALFNDIKIVDGAVKNNQFNSFYLARMKNLPPRVHTSIIKNEYEPTGVGEPPTAPAAAALVNAIFAACGKRIRRMPVSESIEI